MIDIPSKDNSHLKTSSCHPRRTKSYSLRIICNTEWGRMNCITEDIWVMCAAHSITVGVGGGTLFLSRKPESNSSHMSVITVESDGLLCFPFLSLCVSSPYFYPFAALLLSHLQDHRYIPRYNIHDHKSHEKYRVWPELCFAAFGIWQSPWLRWNEAICQSNRSRITFNTLKWDSVYIWKKI